MDNVYKIKTKLKTPGFKPIAKVDCTFFDTSNSSIGYPGICYIFGFDNGYGAEVRKNYLVNGYTENKWELDLLCEKDGEWVHDIHHAITGYNFLDYLSDDDVTDILTWIRDGRLDEAWCANEIAEDYHDISDADIYDDYGDGEVARYKDCLMDCNEKLSYLGPKVREYEDTRKRIEKGE